MTDQALKTTPLNAAHRALGARMVGFGGYDMPVQYEGVLAEHRWTREHAGLFDVSHMGQCKITGEDATAQFERFVPGDYEILKAGKQKYSLLLNKDGGIIDDLMAGRPDHDGLFVVVNAGNKDEDFAFWEANLQGDAKLTVLDRALIAIQGPEAAEVMAAHEPLLTEMGFMECARLMLFGVDCYVSRSGYTGEDGYEISVPADQAERVWNTILEDARVKPIGLGARDSLRLEAGLPLHGHDIDPTTSPVEGALTFALSKSRKERADFSGADRILKELADGPSRVRIGLIVKEGAPAREGAEIADADGNVIGKVTSGGPSPTLGKNIAMGFVPPAYAALGTELKVVVRGKSAAAEVVAMPFVAQRYYRKPKTV
ncbi:MAG: glycine cleavage system aminomethyltransferase GcvT [Alphaproteobacteria bacterium]|jgi:aminomethyltransferase|uniref:aminomethyltransferase n=1 Tax=Brevundimonas mediterranea TaxID=74329 RepID=A0A7Z9C8I0_9CAUL|nr:glycine cleavage system aminomethyltransferase GcvT [Brevundimonas mediterranea]MBU4195976.1 glycine cleavage system aminomethyltransferase GcvT [Alphaproteobacteria bacterium]MBU4238102.1 glycine cleavage system aminomethyltransferase GcvT [Alphaproteobacteria bacterium]VDC51888.1 Aminomethyltransferase [Brevundimonas mediterranea]